MAKVVSECLEGREQAGLFGMPDEKRVVRFRTVRGFLWQALKIGNVERRFCFARWREECVSTGSSDSDVWVPVCWVDER